MSALHKFRCNIPLHAGGYVGTGALLSVGACLTYLALMSSQVHRRYSHLIVFKSWCGSVSRSALAAAQTRAAMADSPDDQLSGLPPVAATSRTLYMMVALCDAPAPRLSRRASPHAVRLSLAAVTSWAT